MYWTKVVFKKFKSRPGISCCQVRQETMRQENLVKISSRDNTLEKTEAAAGQVEPVGRQPGSGPLSLDVRNDFLDQGQFFPGAYTNQRLTLVDTDPGFEID
jgi:hypothetical protein